MTFISHERRIEGERGSMDHSVLVKNVESGIGRVFELGKKLLQKNLILIFNIRDLKEPLLDASKVWTTFNFHILETPYIKKEAIVTTCFQLLKDLPGGDNGVWFLIYLREEKPGNEKRDTDRRDPADHGHRILRHEP
mgnify:CR=1 FL=1